MVDPAAEDRRRRFEAVVAATYVPLQRYLRRRTDPASADDVLGDVLLVMWRRAEVKPRDFTEDTHGRLRALYAQ